MSEQDSYIYKRGRTSFGIFYPTDYITAVFDSYEIAQRGEQIMLSAGYAEDEVHAFTPKYVMERFEEGTRNASFMKRVEHRLTSHFGSDASYWTADLERAKQGAGFLVVYCPTDHEAERVLRLLKSENPKTMRRYHRFVIEELI